MTKKEFIQILQKVRVGFNTLSERELKYLGIFDPTHDSRSIIRTVPIGFIHTTVPTNSYKISKKGFLPRVGIKMDIFKEYPFNDEQERLRVVNKLNKKIYKIREDHNWHMGEPDPPMLIMSYPVEFLVDVLPFQKRFTTLGFSIDDRTLYQLCLTEKNITQCWNSTIYGYYNELKSEKYSKWALEYLEWFEDNDLTINDYKSFYKEDTQINTENQIELNDENIFRCDGDQWIIKYNGVEKFIKQSKGMEYIALLLRHQGQRLHSMEMYQTISGIVQDVDGEMSKASSERIESDEGLQIDGKDGFELVDQKSIDAAKNERKKLENQHNQAMLDNNSVHENKISFQIKQLDDYISKHTYKGKIRTTADATERMRISIYMAIKTAKNNINKSHEELFNHLNKFITTGTFNSYSPDSPVSWFQDR